MISVFLNWIYIAVTAYILGFAFSKIVERAFHYQIKEMNSVIFSGLVIATVYAQGFSLLYKVGIAANLVMVLVCFGAAAFWHRDIVTHLQAVWRGNYKIRKAMLFVLIVLWAYCTSRGYMHYDSDLYHAQSIRWIEEYGVVKGLGNIHVRFAYNSSFFALSALYSMKFLLGQSLHTVNGFIALLLSAEVLKLADIVRHKGVQLSDFARLGAFYYLTVIYRDIVAPASDYAIMCVVFYIIVKWLEQLGTDRHNITPFALLCVAGTFAVSLKLTAGLLLFLTIKPAFMLIKEHRWKEIGVFIGMGVVILLPWIARTVVISGYLLYPFPALDLLDVDWKIGVEAAALDAAEIKTWGRGLNNAALVDLPIAKWFPNWFRTELPTIGKILVLADITCVVLFVFLLIYVWAIKCKMLRKMEKQDGRGIGEGVNWPQNSAECRMDELLVLGTVCMSYLFWQCSAPLLRYGYAYVLLVVVLTVGMMYDIVIQYADKKMIKHKKKVVSQASMENTRCASELASRVFALIVVIFTVVKFVSLAGYISSVAQKPYYLRQSDYGTYALQNYEVNGVLFYYPETGDRVGYHQFPAIPRKIDVEFRGNEIKEGFYGN